MKKLIKKISLLSISLMILLSGFKVKALDIEISNNIVMEEELYSNTQNYIYLTGTLKNDVAQVEQQYIGMTKEKFDEIVNQNNHINKYVTEQNSIIQEKVNKLKEEKNKLDELQAIASLPNSSPQERFEYQEAKTKYDNNALELETYRNNFEYTFESEQNKLRNLLPKFDDTKWKKLSLTGSTSLGNKYPIDYFDDASYFISWVKVTLAGKSYYQYMVYCKKQTPPKYYCEIKDGKYYDNNGNEVTEEVYKKECEPEEKICKIENGKYYNKKGEEVTEEVYRKECEPENPKTGLNMNYLYAVLIPLVALSSYIVIRKAKKFSK